MRTLALTAALLAFPAVAAAGDCVTLDAARDSLSPDEQRAAVVLLEDTILAAGGCGAGWTVSHVRLGETVTVRLSSQGMSQQLSVSQVEELPAAYERLVRALQTGQPVSGTADRDSVTAAEQQPRRVEADTLVYVQLGGGAIGVSQAAAGTAFGFGYRYALDKVAIDLGALNAIIPGDDGAEQGAVTLVELSALRYADGGAARSAYYGGGLGYGVGINEDSAKGGLQLQATAGYELLRHSTIRFFPQLDLTLPVYQIDGETWLPSAAVTLNVAFTPPERQAAGIRVLR